VNCNTTHYRATSITIAMAPLTLILMEMGLVTTLAADQTV